LNEGVFGRRGCFGIFRCEGLNEFKERGEELLILHKPPLSAKDEVFADKSYIPVLNRNLLPAWREELAVWHRKPDSQRVVGQVNVIPEEGMLM